MAWEQMLEILAPPQMVTDVCNKQAAEKVIFLCVCLCFFLLATCFLVVQTESHERDSDVLPCIIVIG